VGAGRLGATTVRPNCVAWILQGLGDLADAAGFAANDDRKQMNGIGQRVPGSREAA
jgi:hypothetical protein